MFHEHYDYDMVEDNRQINICAPLGKNRTGNPLAIGCSGGAGHIAAINAILASFDQSCLCVYSPAPYKKKPLSLAGLSIFTASYINYSPYMKNFTNALGLPILPVHHDLKSGIEELEKANSKPRLYIDMLLDVYPAGYENAAIWNILQRQDQINELAKLINLQSQNDLTFFTHVSDYFLEKLITAHKNLNPYTEVISTQSQGLPALCDAVKKYNELYHTQILINQYMTDLPTHGAVHFFNALSKLAPIHQQQMNIYAVGLNQSVIKHFFEEGCFFNGLYTINPKNNPMVRPGFSRENDNSNKLNTHITLRGDNIEPLMITPGEQVACIMLGSQASADTEKYIDILVNTGLQKIVVFCGSNAALKEKIMNNYSASLNKIILLGNQGDAFIASIMTRSNIIITRAGGLSVMEQMAMDHNREQIIMIHHADSEKYTDDQPVYIHNVAENANSDTVRSEVISEPELLQSGILWEDQNADLLIRILPVRVIKTCPSEFGQQLTQVLTNMPTIRTH